MKKKINWLPCFVVAGLMLCGCDKDDYNKANDLVNNGQYDEAIAIYKELVDYKDCTQLISAAKYAKAEDLLASGEFDAAENIFGELGGYKDSSSRILETKYTKAEHHFNLSEFDIAISIYTELGEYSDCREKLRQSHIGLSNKAFEANDFLTAIDEMYEADPENLEYIDNCYYKNAEKLISEENYQEAIDSLTEIKKMECKDLLLSTKYSLGLQLLDKKNYSEAAIVFSKIEYKDSNSLANYAKGMDYVNAGNYTKAIDAFSKTNNVYDSEAMSQQCLEILYKECCENISNNMYENIGKNLEVLVKHNYKDSANKLKEITMLFDTVAGTYNVTSSTDYYMYKEGALIRINSNYRNGQISISFFHMEIMERIQSEKKH
ncbi:MAG: tetratricopeptide repeat protein [Oscillospiraceae bacterium]|nr:tetratricopeptide repeat protein [Oscillospiraceae bacterium]